LKGKAMSTDAAKIIFLAFLVSLSSSGEELTGNLILDGGMEEWVATGPMSPGWSYLTSDKNISLSKNAMGEILTPKINSQFSECKTLERDSGARAGNFSLRLRGGIFLTASPLEKDAYRTESGDVYAVRFWAKGEGNAALYLHVYGNGKAQIVERKGKLEKDKWSLIEERIQVSGSAPTTIYPRLYSPREALFDDIFVGRVISGRDYRAESIPLSYQARVAFASAAEERIIVDGKLSEASWRQAVAFGGFRPYNEQTLLSPLPFCFKILKDSDSLCFGFEIPLGDCAGVLHDLRARPLTDSAGKLHPKEGTYTARESVEMFIQPPGSEAPKQFVRSLDGYCFDNLKACGSGIKPKIESSAGIEDGKWILEMRIPLSALSLESPPAADGWRINVCLNRPSGALTWASVGTHFNSADSFGCLVLRDVNAWRTEAPSRIAALKRDITNKCGILGFSADSLCGAPDGSVCENPGQVRDIRDWKEAARVYSELKYPEDNLRRALEELRYLAYFKEAKK
jgi:hypothetical protein